MGRAYATSCDGKIQGRTGNRNEATEKVSMADDAGETDTGQMLEDLGGAVKENH